MRCADQNCRRTESVRKWSAYCIKSTHSKRLVVAFVADTSVKPVSIEYGASRSTVTNFYDNIRGRWSDDLAENPLQFADGGEYEVDDAQLKRIQDGQGNMLAYI